MPKKPPADPQSCATCRFFTPNRHDERGICWRGPPVPLVLNDEIVSAQSTTSSDRLCGCWERKLNS